LGKAGTLIFIAGDAAILIQRQPEFMKMVKHVMTAGIAKISALFIYPKIEADKSSARDQFSRTRQQNILPILRRLTRISRLALRVCTGRMHMFRNFQRLC